jgi:hypothetical protein
MKRSALWTDKNAYRLQKDLLAECRPKSLNKNVTIHGAMFYFSRTINQTSASREQPWKKSETNLKGYTFGVSESIWDKYPFIYHCIFKDVTSKINVFTGYCRLFFLKDKGILFTGDERVSFSRMQDRMVGLGQNEPLTFVSTVGRSPGGPRGQERIPSTEGSACLMPP